MDKFLYLAGPIADCTLDEAVVWRDYVKERLALNVIGISPMRDKADEAVVDGRIPRDVLQFDKLLMANHNAIYTRDRYDCTNADGLIVYLPKAYSDRCPSIGTLIEIGWASANNIPIILITDNDQLKNHPIVMHSVGFIVDDLDSGIEVANAIWGAYASRPVAQVEHVDLLRRDYQQDYPNQIYAAPPPRPPTVQWGGVVQLVGAQAGGAYGASLGGGAGGNVVNYQIGAYAGVGTAPEILDGDPA